MNPLGVGMRFNGECWDGNTAASNAPENTLTADKMLEMMRQFEQDFPPLPSVKFDLCGHDLGDEAYELPALADEFCIPGTKGRRMLVVPRNKLDFWEYELRRHGADVRREPRIRDTVPTDEGSKP